MQGDILKDVSDGLFRYVIREGEQLALDVNIDQRLTISLFRLDAKTNLTVPVFEEWPFHDVQDLQQILRSVVTDALGSAGCTVLIE